MAEEKKVTVIVALGGRMEVIVQDTIDPQELIDHVVKSLNIDLSHVHQPFTVLADNATGEHVPLDRVMPVTRLKDSNMLRVVLPLKVEE